jgi:hypothetical protein
LGPVGWPPDALWNEADDRPVLVMGPALVESRTPFVVRRENIVGRRQMTQFCAWLMDPVEIFCVVTALERSSLVVFIARDRLVLATRHKSSRISVEPVESSCV